MRLDRVIGRVMLMLLGFATAVYALRWGIEHFRVHQELTWHTAGGVLLGVYAGAMLIDQRVLRPFRAMTNFALRMWTRTPPPPSGA